MTISVYEQESVLENLSNLYNYAITRKQAVNLYINNYSTEADLIAEAGDRQTYNLSKLREKLGY